MQCTGAFCKLRRTFHAFRHAGGCFKRRRYESGNDQMASPTLAPWNISVEDIRLYRQDRSDSGAPIVTTSGLVFIENTFDPYIRGFDVQTGKGLWKAQLPASGNATPMTYSVNGKQYRVIAAGGHPKITEEALNHALVAFTLQ
jgi:PQQ enzyme repeat